MKNFSKIEYEFKELELKIYRLKKIEKGLNALDIKGFESDTIKIKSRLKDLDMVDEVEKEFVSLKNKINEKKRQYKEQYEENKQKRKERELNEIKNLIHETENIIEEGKYNATNAKNPFFLSGLIHLQADFQKFYQEFEIGRISFMNAKSRVLDFMDKAKTLRTPLEEKTYYDILDINLNASQDEIRKAFRRKSLKYHPDEIASWADIERVPKWVNEKAEKLFKKLNEAHEVLSDPKKRREYNKKIGR